MLSVVDIFFSLIDTLLLLLLLGISIGRRCVLRYFPVNLYAAVLLLSDGVRYFVLWRFGLRSPQYFYAFYTTEACLVAATFLIIISFYEVIFRRTSLRTTVRLTLTFFVALIAVISYAMIASKLSSSHFYSHLLVEFLQNMHFAAVILTVLLWISVNYLRVEDSQLRLLIAGLGVCLCVQTATYAFQNLLPQEVFLHLQKLGIISHILALATALKLGLWCMAVSGYRLAERKPARAEVLAPVEAKGGL